MNHRILKKTDVLNNVLNKKISLNLMNELNIASKVNTVFSNSISNLKSNLNASKFFVVTYEFLFEELSGLLHYFQKINIGTEKELYEFLNVPSIRSLLSNESSIELFNKIKMLSSTGVFKFVEDVLWSSSNGQKQLNLKHLTFVVSCPSKFSIS